MKNEAKIKTIRKFPTLTPQRSAEDVRAEPLGVASYFRRAVVQRRRRRRDVDVHVRSPTRHVRRGGTRRIPQRRSC